MATSELADSRPRHVVVVGGGIAGLSTAYYLQQGAREAKMPLRITLLEAEASLGGKVQTERPDGLVIEGGPDCFLRRKPWALDLCRELGLEGEVMGTNDARRQVFVWRKGRLVPLPEGVFLVVPTRIWPFVTSRLISWPGKARMAMDWFLPPKRDGGDESVGAFVRRRLGQEALDVIAEPLMSGIHIADPERQSLLATFPIFRQLEEEHGSLLRGMLAARRARGRRSSAGGGAPASVFVTLRGGMGDLVRALARALDGTDVLTSAPVHQVERQAGGGYLVRLEHGQGLAADAVVLATPAFVSAEILRDLSPQLAEALGRLPYVSSATISLAFRREDLGKDLDGFGFVVPRREGRRLLACTFSSTKFAHRAPEGMALLRCFVGGPGQEHLVEWDDDALLRLVREELRAIMGLQAWPVQSRIFRWWKANPQYEVGHLDWVEEVRALCASEPGLFLTGSAFEGVGLPDCVRQGRDAARQALAHLGA